MNYMTNKIVAIQGDIPSKLNPETDTSIFLANEIQNKRYKIFYYEPKDLSIINSKVVAKGYFVSINYNKKKFFKILKKKNLELVKCKFILIRQNPPFNLEYISTTYILDSIKTKVKIINDPTSIRSISEKLYSSKYQKYMPNTIFTQNISEIKAFFKKNKKVILKPIHGYSGNDIHLLTRFKSNLVKRFVKKNGHIMCQKFLPKINKGDKRVFVINGKLCGVISRIPKKGFNTQLMGKDLYYWSSILLNLARKGLQNRDILNKKGNNETVFLNHLQKVIDNKITNADHMISKFSKNENLDELYDK